MTNEEFYDLDAKEMEQVAGGFAAGVPGSPGAQKPNKKNACAEWNWLKAVFLGGWAWGKAADC